MQTVRLIIVRHGERQDQANPGFAKSTLRPHDPPLSLRGASQAQDLGRFLSARPDLVPPRDDGLVVMSSPLLRCLQTAVHVLGEIPRHGVVPVFTEPNLVEVAASLAADWRKSPSLAGTDMPEPPWMPLDAARTRLIVPDGVVLRPSMTGCRETACLVRDAHGRVSGDDHERRAALLLVSIAADRSLVGKTVIIVTHAHMALALRRGCTMHGADDAARLPELTSFACFDVTRGAGADCVPEYRALQADFATPHLPRE